MSDSIEGKMNNKEKAAKSKESLQENLSDTLLALDKKTNKVDLVDGVDTNGNLIKTDSQKKNSKPFIRIDRGGDFFSNFFSNFISQLKNPTEFSFFKISELGAMQTAKELQEYVDTASPKELETLKDYEIIIQNSLTHKNQNKMATKSTETENQTQQESPQYRYQPEQIDWQIMAKFGLDQEKLTKMNVLDRLLRGFKSHKLVPITINLGNAVSRMDVRLSLQTNDSGQVLINLHGIRKEPDFKMKFLGHEFSEQDKENLRNTGNMGRVVDLVNPKTNEIIPSIISKDRLTNELVALNTNYMKIPDEIKGLKLNDEQKQILSEGKPLYLEGMISSKGDSFNASVQFNAEKRYVEFLIDPNKKLDQVQNRQQTVNEEPQKVFRGKELTDQQFNNLKEGKSVYLSGLIDQKGNTYNGYITYSKENKTTDFSFQNPAKIVEQAKPDEAHKTQVAVNSEGKTNEATKNIKEPLESAQTNPLNKKQAEDQHKTKQPTRSRRRKL
ncbi:DUF3945 domain-containing protein [Chryseobacterium luquanense]|uniref:DUF3945 domain-containing protein n=1 Tax=Chryseobacterium luquanense TaxID=2983766 RepID=A0ABT3XY78_9FLAO|nr:DUF3945 domain-containing protein [Chryseobacterium luquanense]MCX8530845.1 DUF3945 domain-containing protein [Chryseobacterium luquanense]